MIVIIAAMDPTGIIGLDGKIPWHYSEDFKRFKVLTKGCTVVMGRATWISLPPKKLPGRWCVVLSEDSDVGEPPDLIRAPENLGLFLRELDNHREKPLYVIGGGTVYKAALESGVVDEVDLTLVPEVPLAAPEAVIRFPVDLLSGFTLKSEGTNPNDPRLTHKRYVRVG
jgi:dihydrofolate reductase